MAQSRLSDLALLSIENKLAVEIDYNDVINDFATLKVRKAIICVESAVGCGRVFAAKRWLT